MIPREVQDRLRSYQMNLAVRNLGLTGELMRVLRLFAEHRVLALPFKGPTLAQFAYGDVALREFGDLDLLLQESDFPRARSLLVDQGYRPHYALTPPQEAAYMRLS